MRNVWVSPKSSVFAPSQSRPKLVPYHKHGVSSSYFSGAPPLSRDQNLTLEGGGKGYRQSGLNPGVGTNWKAEDVKATAVPRRGPRPDSLGLPPSCPGWRWVLALQAELQQNEGCN